MPRPFKNKLLHVRSHLEYVQTVIEGLQKYGMCPLLEEELKKLSFLNRTILRKADQRAAAGDRKDLYVTKR